MAFSISLSEMRHLVDMKNSCVISKVEEIMVSILPVELRNVSEGIIKCLNDLTYGYCRKLGGLVLGFEDLKQLNRHGIIKGGDPRIHYRIRGVFYVFAPKVGLTIKSTLQDCVYNQANFLVFKKYNVTFRCVDHSPEMSRLMSKLMETNSNEEVTLKLTEVVLRDFLPDLRGYPVYEEFEAEYSNEDMVLPAITTPVSKKVCFDDDNLCTDLEESYILSSSKKHKNDEKNSANLVESFEVASDEELKVEKLSPTPTIKEELPSETDDDTVPKKKKKEKLLVCLSDEDQIPKNNKKENLLVSNGKVKTTKNKKQKRLLCSSVEVQTQKQEKNRLVSSDENESPIKQKNQLCSSSDKAQTPKSKKEKRLLCSSVELEIQKQNKKKKNRLVSSDENESPIKQENLLFSSSDGAKTPKKKKEKRLVSSDENETVIKTEKDSSDEVETTKKMKKKKMKHSNSERKSKDYVSDVFVNGCTDKVSHKKRNGDSLIDCTSEKKSKKRKREKSTEDSPSLNFKKKKIKLNASFDDSFV